MASLKGPREAHRSLFVANQQRPLEESNLHSDTDLHQTVPPQKDQHCKWVPPAAHSQQSRGWKELPSPLPALHRCGRHCPRWVSHGWHRNSAATTDPKGRPDGLGRHWVADGGEYGGWRWQWKSKPLQWGGPDAPDETADRLAVCLERYLKASLISCQACAGI